MSLGVLVIGSGQRVRRAALPALLARSESCHITGLLSRKPKQIAPEDTAGQPCGKPMQVGPLAELDSRALAAADLVYVCVSKGAVPKVLAQLAGLAREAGAAAPALLIDTPVLYFKHMAAARHFSAFAAVWVAEDMSTLPWLDAIGALGPALGAPKSLLLDRSAFAYHGVALAKTLLGCKTLVASRRRSLGEGRHERILHFCNQTSCRVLEPRDYALGSFRLELERGTICDPSGGPTQPGDLVLSTRFEGSSATGFDLHQPDGKTPGEPLASTALAPHEVELLGSMPTPRAPGVIAHMDAMKRVGFARLLDRIAAEQPIWSLFDGLDDMWIDYLTEKTGRWRRTPLTSAHSPLARRLVGLTMAAALKLKR